MKNVGFVCSTMAVTALVAGPWALPRASASAIDSGVWEKLTCTQYGKSTLAAMPCESSGNTIVATNADANAFGSIGEMTDVSMHGQPGAAKTVQADLLLKFDNGMQVVPVTFEVARQAFSAQITAAACQEATFAAGAMYTVKASFADGSGFEFRVPVLLENRSNLSEAVSSALDIAQSQADETDVYPPGMFDPLTDIPQYPPGIQPGQLSPSGKFAEPPANPSPGLSTAAFNCYLQYLAACRAAQTTWVTAIIASRTDDTTDALAGGGLGGAAGAGAGGAIVILLGCLTGGPIGAGIAILIVTSAGAGTGTVLAIANVVKGDEVARKAANDARKAQLDAAWTAYLKCLIGLGYRIL